MVRSRFENLEPEKQERLFQVAAEEFADRGYEAASLNQIIDRSGMSKGSLYYYFEDKADLYSTVVERATGLMIKLLGGFSMEDLTAENFWPTFEEMMRNSTRHLESNAWFMKLMRSFYRLRGTSPRRGGTARVFNVVRRWTTDILRRGQELGAVRRDLPLEFLVEITLGMGEAGDRWMLEHWERLSSEERERVINADMVLFRRLLEPVDAPSSSVAAGKGAGNP